MCIRDSPSHERIRASRHLSRPSPLALGTGGKRTDTHAIDAPPARARVRSPSHRVLVSDHSPDRPTSSLPHARSIARTARSHRLRGRRRCAAAGQPLDRERERERESARARASASVPLDAPFTTHPDSNRSIECVHRCRHRSIDRSNLPSIDRTFHRSIEPSLGWRMSD